MIRQPVKGLLFLIALVFGIAAVRSMARTNETPQARQVKTTDQAPVAMKKVENSGTRAVAVD